MFDGTSKTFCDWLLSEMRDSYQLSLGLMGLTSATGILMDHLQQPAQTPVRCGDWRCIECSMSAAICSRKVGILDSVSRFFVNFTGFYCEIVYSIPIKTSNPPLRNPAWSDIMIGVCVCLWVRVFSSVCVWLIRAVVQRRLVIVMLLGLLSCGTVSSHLFSTLSHKQMHTHTELYRSCRSYYLSPSALYKHKHTHTPS